MKLLRAVLWLAALLPCLAAFVWAAFASRLPDVVAASQARGEASSVWDYASLLDFHAEPAQVLARAMQLGLLHVPGMTLAHAAHGNALLALAVVALLVALLRRTGGIGAPARPFAWAVAGLLACSPAFGADWLYGQRLGLFVPVWSLLLGCWLLAGEGRTGWRGAAALLLAAQAPFWHTHGILVFLALLPSLAEAMRRAASARQSAWIVALLLVGNLAAVFVMLPAGGLALGERGLLGQFVAAPAATCEALLFATGSLWLDPVPSMRADQVALGAASWLLPPLFWFVGDRSAEARRAAAPWWGCVTFGLLHVLLQAERFGALPVDAVELRALAWGGFLLPIGCIGVLAARCGTSLWGIGAGALAVLGLQDWAAGTQNLRLGQARAQRAEVVAAAPRGWLDRQLVVPLPLEQREVLGVLAERGWAPAANELPAPLAGAADLGLAAVDGGDPAAVRGTVRASLWRDSVDVVLCCEVVGEEVGAPLAIGWPEPGEARLWPWSATFATPLAEGTRLRVFGLDAGSRVLTAIGPCFVVRGGKLVAETGP